jgi:hypothetical protein
MNPSGVPSATTVVAYGVPEVRPTCRRMTHSGNQRRPANRLAIGPNDRARARNGALWRGRPATKSEDVVVFIG